MTDYRFKFGKWYLIGGHASRVGTTASVTMRMTINGYPEPTIIGKTLPWIPGRSGTWRKDGGVEVSPRSANIKRQRQIVAPEFTLFNGTKMTGSTEWSGFLKSSEFMFDQPYTFGQVGIPDVRTSCIMNSMTRCKIPNNIEIGKIFMYNETYVPETGKPLFQTFHSLYN